MVRFKLFAVLILLLAIPALLFAQETPPAEQAGMTARLDDIMSMQVASQDGSVQATISDLVLSAAGDIAHFAIQTQDGQTYVVPADQITVEGEQVTLQAGQDQLQQFPTMEGDQLPEEVAMAEDGTQNILANQLQGASLVAQDGQELGQVEGAMFNLQELRVEYLGVAPSGVLGLSQPLYAVPPDAIQEINAEQGQITANIGADQFGQYQGFSEDSWPEQAVGGEMMAPAEEPAPAQ